MAGIQAGRKRSNANTNETETDFVTEMTASWGKAPIPMFREREALLAA